MKDPGEGRSHSPLKLESPITPNWPERLSRGTGRADTLH